MLGGLSLDKMALIVLTVVSVAVGTGILYTVNTSGEDIHPVESSLKKSDFSACKDFKTNQTVGIEGFRTILYARHLDVCEKKSNNVTLSFNLTKNRLEKITSGLSSEPKTIYRDSCDKIKGLNGVIVEDTGNKVIGSYGEIIQFKDNKPVRICQK